MLNCKIIFRTRKKSLFVLLKYKHNYVDIDDSVVGNPITTLKQLSICPHKKDYIYGEAPKVEKFVCDHI